MADPTRRDFLKLSTKAVLAACGLLGLDGLLRFLSFSSEPPPKTESALGAASNYPVGSRTVLADVPAVLIRDETGFSALSLVCPHLGCRAMESGDGFICPCHGSQFDKAGELRRGPATQALRHLRVEVSTDDQVHLYLN